ncbi:hypothetical protein Scep_001408 [Stephania cephalantha]|uniref:Uncharacterized protein n=1 Tax=Stephania cephalantha TaxID=152367 RepID=A0AAP0L9C1_9MAGN
MSSEETINSNVEKPSLLSRVRKECLSCFVSVQEGLTHAKATLLGQAHKMTSKNEEEATQADLRTAKAQVEATDAAEDTKKRLQIS